MGIELELIVLLAFMTIVGPALRDAGAVVVAVSLMISLFVGFLWQSATVLVNVIYLLVGRSAVQKKGSSLVPGLHRLLDLLDHRGQFLDDVVILASRNGAVSFIICQASVDAITDTAKTHRATLALHDLG